MSGPPSKKAKTHTDTENKIYDLRSDTVTKPTDKMRKAMSEAEVGDDVFGDDPTVIKLEALSAQLLGKEAALFVASGTQGNLIACMVHCDSRDSEMILGDQSHIHCYEQGSCATLGHIHPATVPNKADGTLDLQELESKIRTTDDHYPITKLVCLENTQNKCGGRCLTAEYTDSVGALCKKHGLKLHLDGARLFNAAVKLKTNVQALAKAADSVSICLSKGLSSPVGSVLCGTKDFIRKARRVRKALGGGLRQAGILAAAGLLSLTEMTDRLDEDHTTAHALASQLAKIHGLDVDVKTIETNIVFVKVVPAEFGLTAEQFRDQLKAKGVLITGANSNSKVRFVTNYHVTSDDVPAIMRIVHDVVDAAHAKSS